MAAITTAKTIRKLFIVLSLLPFGRCSRWLPVCLCRPALHVLLARYRLSWLRVPPSTVWQSPRCLSYRVEPGPRRHQRVARWFAQPHMQARSLGPHHRFCRSLQAVGPVRSTISSSQQWESGYLPQPEKEGVCESRDRGNGKGEQTPGAACVTWGPPSWEAPTWTRRPRAEGLYHCCQAL